MNASRILGLGTATPPFHISQARAVDVARAFVHQADASVQVLPALYRMTRVATRGSVLLEGPSEDHVQQSFYPQATDANDRGPDTAQRMQRYAQEASGMAMRSAQAALRDSQVPVSEISHLITVTCTGFYAPGFDVDLIEGLGLHPEVQRIQIGFMGCHAAINALRAARAIANADSMARVLIVAVELCSLHYQYGWDPDRVVANAIFADGSAAMVVGAGVGESSNGIPPSIIDTGSRWIPDSRGAMTWEIGNHGFEMTLAATVPGIIERYVPEFLKGWLERYGLSTESIGGWAVHPGGPRILTAVEAALGLPAESLECSRDVLRRHGNMSSPTLVYILDEMRQRRVPGPWLMMGFGPGLEVEVALLGE